MSSHFLQLFKRGRYVTVRSLAAAESDEKTRHKRHEERERFSVAAVAFCLEHDRVFKTHFLKVIARIPPDAVTSATLEPECWGDLVLEGPQEVLVLEFKLDALLQEHQAPQARIFLISGYGKKIKERFTKSGKLLRYIVIGKDFEPCNREGLRCNVVPWRKFLVPDDRKETKTERDLYDCLGYLGATVFLNRHMKQRKLAEDSRRAMVIAGTLKHLLAAVGLPPLAPKLDPEYCGVEISSAGATPGSLHAKLVALVRPKGRALGWIGYELVDGLPSLAVWFYSTAKTSRAVHRRLGFAKGLGTPEEQDNWIYIRLLGGNSTDDAQWFQKVLRTAGGRPAVRP